MGFVIVWSYLRNTKEREYKRQGLELNKPSLGCRKRKTKTKKLRASDAFFF